MARKKSDDKRQRILQAAARVFARKGYHGARVSEIARRAEVADGTIYLYFRDKEDILVSLFDEVMREHLRRAHEEIERASRARARSCWPWPAGTWACWAATATWPWSSRWSCASPPSSWSASPPPGCRTTSRCSPESSRRARRRAACAPTCRSSW